MPFYAVRRGKCPGIYNTWAECKAQIDKFTGARYKKFETEVEANNFVNGFDSPACKASSSTVKPDYGNKVTQFDKIVKEIEVLKEQLKLKEAERDVLEAQMKLEQLKGKSTPGKTTPNKTVLHNVKPYDKLSSTSSSTWKQNRVTQLIDDNETRQLHTSACQDSDSDTTPTVYTDGACVNNGTRHAKAGIGVFWGSGHPLNVSERLPGRQTNNRAEIFAVVKAVEQAKLQGFSELTVKTDSQFLINSMTKWVPGWIKKGWKTAGGKPVINKEDFETLLASSEGVHINWVHVKGHQGVEGNEAADKLAYEGASKPPC